MVKFVDVLCIGAENREYVLLVNVDDISRLHHDEGVIEFKTPLPDGTHSAIMAQDDFEELAELLRDF